MNVVWTDERKAEVAEMRGRRLSIGQIAQRLGMTRSAISGVVFRLGLTKAPAAPRKPRAKNKTITPRHYYAKRALLEPSRTPFASDSSCPDFAWDDDHCASVNANGGYPIMPQRAVTSQTPSRKDTAA